jgi:hypothetical protein
MRAFLSMTRKLGGMATACFIVLATCGFPAYGQQSPQNNTASVVFGQKQEDQAGKIRMNDENVAHSYFSDIGVPAAAGVFHPRLFGLATRAESHTEGNFTSPCGTRLTSFKELHVINEKFPANPRTIAAFQFKDATSKVGMNGFSPLIDSKASMPIDDAKGANTLAGFSTTAANPQTFFNQANITTRENTGRTAVQPWVSDPSKICAPE